jgi:hypothetical protein
MCGSDMNKKNVFIILLLTTGLVAINDETKTAKNTNNVSSLTMRSSCPRSITPCGSPESSDSESEFSDSDDEDDVYMPENIVFSWSTMAKPYLERYGGYFFGGALAVLITYKFYRAGYV